MATPITTLLIDLDDTIYPPTSGVWQAIGDRINRFMAEHVGIPAERVLALRQEYYIAYGTTLNGLRMHYGVDADEYLAFVHDLPLDRLLSPDARLRAMLKELPQRKAIFSNADRLHAARVLSRLGVDDCFEQIIDIHALGLASKPEPESYTRALELLGAPSPNECMVVDDLLRNLLPAGRMGMRTVWVHPDGLEAVTDYRIASIHDLPGCLLDLPPGLISL